MKLLSIITSIARIIMFLSSILGLFYGIKYYKRLYELSYFIFLFLFSLLDSITYLVIVTILKKQEIFLSISPIVQGIYLIVEFSIFCIFLIKQLEDEQLKLFIKIILLIVVISAIIFISIGINPFNKYYFYFILIEFLIVNVFCIIIFMKNVSNDLKIQNWNINIVKGLFIFINFTAPYYVISQYINPQKIILLYSLNSINDFGYSILFLYIFNSFRWLTEKKKL